MATEIELEEDLLAALSPEDRRVVESAVDDFERWRGDMVAFCLEVFLPAPELDIWQLEVCEKIPIKERIALAACKGPGKTAELAMFGWWVLACHVDAQGEALAITKDNLKDNLWKELGVWYSRSPLLQLMFVLGPERIRSRERPGTWFLAARSYAQNSSAAQQATALSGLHADHVFYLLDEIGDMAPAVIDAAKGIFTVQGQRGWILGAGNRSTQRGALYYIENDDVRSWDITVITGDPDDPNRSSRVDIDNARLEIEKHGRDDPWVKVNILGQYPPVSSDQRISSEAVAAAMQRDESALTYRGEARIWGVDPAYSDRSGADEAVLARRQGLLMRPMMVWHGLDGPQLAGRIGVAILEAEKNGEAPDKIFCDKGGVGTSCYDHLKLLGWEHLVVGIDFGQLADEPEKYYDKRSEIWDQYADWIEKTPSMLPSDPTLKSELISPRWGPKRKGNRTVFKLESKIEMKARNVRSPNRGDAGALTFSAPVMPRSAEDNARTGLSDAAVKVKTEYDLYPS